MIMDLLLHSWQAQTQYSWFLAIFQAKFANALLATRGPRRSRFILRTLWSTTNLTLGRRAALGYEGKNKIVVVATGEEGHAELLKQFTPSASLFCLLRLNDGDRESQRIKFVFLTFVGEAVSGLALARVGSHMGSIKPLLGQFNIEMRADTLKECAEDIIRKKLKVAVPAHSAAAAHARRWPAAPTTTRAPTPLATSLPATSRPRLWRRTRPRQAHAVASRSDGPQEKEGNVAGVVYVTTALPSTTPVNLAGRPMVASATEAKKWVRSATLHASRAAGTSRTAWSTPASSLGQPPRR